MAHSLFRAVRKARVSLLIGVLCVLCSVWTSSSAHAMDRDTKAILTMAGYGVVGGTVLGLATYPFAHNTRNIFIGSSVGLYLGIVIGVFYVLNDYNADRPFPDQDLSYQTFEIKQEMPQALVRFEAPVLRF